MTGISGSLALRRLLLPFAALVFAMLSGCNGGWIGEGDDDILPGERVAISGARDTVAPSQVASAEYSEDLRDLGPAVEVPFWLQTGALPSRGVGHIAGPENISLAWSVSLGDSSSSSSSVVVQPVVTTTTIFALDARSTLIAANRVDGTLLWETDLTPEGEYGEEGFGGGLAAADGRVFAATGFGEVVAVDDKTGAILWRTQTGAPVRSSPLAAARKIYVVDRDNSTYAIDSVSGAVVWSAPGPPSTLSTVSAPGPALMQKILVVPLTNGDLVAYNAQNGQGLWVAPTGLRPVDQMIPGVSSGPVIAGNGVFAGSRYGGFAAFELSSGRAVWSRELGSENPAIFAGRTLFLITSEPSIVRLNIMTGETLWHRSLPKFVDAEDRKGEISYFGPLLIGGKLFLSSSAGQMLVFDGKSGESLDEIALEHAALTAPVFAEDTIYIYDQEATMHAFR